MRRKGMVLGLLLLALPFVNLPLSAEAEDSDYAAYNLTIQPGSNETELNFTWFIDSEDEPDQPQLIIFEEGHLKNVHKGKHKKSKKVFTYEATCELVEVTESAGGGQGGPPPGATTSSETDTTSDDSEEESETPVYSCKAIATQLKNNSHYAYFVSDDDVASDIYYFDTKNAHNFNFIFVGDPQIGASRDVDSDSDGWAMTVSDALAMFPNTSFILSAGDQVESSTSDAQYDGFLSAEDLTSVPFAPAIGNHDTSELYAYHFNVPNESELGTTDGGGDYWFTCGDTLFMVLNTNNSSALSHSEFLAQSIASNANAKWRIVVFHHSIYSSAKHVSDVNDLRTSMYPVIDEYDIDIVLSGHDHFYARTYQLSGGTEVESVDSITTIGTVVEDEQHYIGQETVLNPTGTVYFTANSASGSKYYDFSYIEGYTNLYLAAYAQLKVPTFFNVEVNEAALTVSAYRVDTMEEVDSYTIVKSGNKHSGHHNH